jgi:hypothetical protein
MARPVARPASPRALRWAAALLLGLSLLVSGSRGPSTDAIAMADRPGAAIGIVLVDATAGTADARSRERPGCAGSWRRCPRRC